MIWEYDVSTMAVDALAPCIARSLATMVFNLQNKQVLVFEEEWFQ